MDDWVFNNDFYQMFLSRPLRLFGFSPKDNTFGRHKIPITEYEKSVRDLNLFYGERWLQGNSETGKIYFQTYWDQSNFPTPKTDVLFVHGYADHGGRYPNMFISFIKAGIRLHLIDLPGHGRSDGVHGAILNLDELKDAVCEVVKTIKVDFSPKKFFLSGISLGGQVIVNSGINEPGLIDGIVGFCPCIEVNDLMKPSEFIISIGRIISRIFPYLMILPRTEGMVSKDPEVIEIFRNDPMAYTKYLRSGTAFSFEDGLVAFSKELHKLKVPIIVLQGVEDRMVDPKGASVLIEKISSRDKTLLTYPGVEHAIFSNSTTEKIISDALNWILTRCDNNLKENESCSIPTNT